MKKRKTCKWCKKSLVKSGNRVFCSRWCIKAFQKSGGRLHYSALSYYRNYNHNHIPRGL